MADHSRADVARLAPTNPRWIESVEGRPEDYPIRILDPKEYGGFIEAFMLGECYNIQIWILDVDSRPRAQTYTTPDIYPATTGASGARIHPSYPVLKARQAGSES